LLRSEQRGFAPEPAHGPEGLLTAFIILSISGTIGLIIAVMTGFEEPDSAVLVISSALLLAAPLTVLMHLLLTRQLTRQEKRAWIRSLTSAGAVSALSAYLKSDDRRAAAK
jgi:hypothetical protein